MKISTAMVVAVVLLVGLSVPAYIWYIRCGQSPGTHLVQLVEAPEVTPTPSRGRPWWAQTDATWRSTTAGEQRH